MKRYLLILFATSLLTATSVTAASDPSPGQEQVSITKQMAVECQPTIALSYIAAPELPYIAVIESEAMLCNDENQVQDGQTVSLIAGNSPVVSADRSVCWSIFIKKPLNYTAILPFKYVEGRATEYRC